MATKQVNITVEGDDITMTCPVQYQQSIRVTVNNDGSRKVEVTLNATFTVNIPMAPDRSCRVTETTDTSPAPPPTPSATTTPDAPQHPSQPQPQPQCPLPNCNGILANSPAQPRSQRQCPSQPPGTTARPVAVVEPLPPRYQPLRPHYIPQRHERSPPRGRGRGWRRTVTQL
ncbi:uncharacterized protein LOC134805485 [Cydia splendana]|uniref:uncharacterized protein LOC134805477 n=1 Tax=Cydia splendana TaxID=1100963 RepID=UPI00300C6BA7